MTAPPSVTTPTNEPAIALAELDLPIPGMTCASCVNPGRRGWGDRGGSVIESGAVTIDVRASDRRFTPRT